MNTVAKYLARASCALLLAPALDARAAGPPETPAMYAAWKDRVVQIQVIERQAGSKAGIGSGFVAGAPGSVVTNYHVIAELLNEPERYRARYLAEDGTSGDLELLGVDAVHDLALLRARGLERDPLQLAQGATPKGERLWSLGYPFDIGLTIVEGTFNGTLQKSLYEKLHFTGSINPGMSGGPTLDAAGGVVGVNVSTAGNQVSFLVPVRHVARLLAVGVPEDVSPAGLHRLVARQLEENQQRIADQLLTREMPVTPLNGYSVPAGLADYVNCWGDSEQDERNLLELVYYQCQTQDDIYLSGSLSTGIIRYQHDLVRTEALGAMRFYRQLERRSHYPRLRLDGDERTVSNYACQTGFVERSGLPMKVTYCVRAYRQLEGLYDAYLSATSLVSNRESLQTTLVVAGFDWQNLQRFSARFLESFTWQP